MIQKTISNISLNKAAIVVGLAMIFSVILGFIVDDLILPNFMRPGDVATLAKDIKADKNAFAYAVVLYLSILACDVSIALGLYIIFKQENKNLALAIAVLRLIYVAFAVVSVLALVFQTIDVYSYETIKLIGYFFFACHLFVTGYSVLKSSYIPKIFGVLLILASFSYIVFYVNFPNLGFSILGYSLVGLIIMLFMAAGEMSLDVWLLIKSAKLAEMLEETNNLSKE